MTRRKIFLLQAAASLAAASVVTGCSGDSHSGTPSASAMAHASEVAALRAVSTCMRTHGFPNFPDPVQDDKGDWGWPPTLDNVKVSSPCDDLVRRAKSLGRKREDKVTAAELTRLRQYSTCMRQHGLADWPDPSDTGVFRLPNRLTPPQGQALLSGPDQACAAKLGGAGIQVEKPAGGN